MRPLFHLFIISFFISSCSTYVATTKSSQNLNYGAVQVTPAWKYEDPKGKKLIVPAVAAAGGAVYGSQTDITWDGKTYEKTESAALLAAAGLAVGSIFNAIIFPKRKASRTNFELSQSEKWVKSFSKVTGIDYVINKKGLDKTLTLVPLEKVLVIRNKFKNLKSDLNKSKSTTSFDDLQDWKLNLKGEYSVLPELELMEMNEVISKHESRIASDQLLSQLNTLTSLDPSFNALQIVSGFKGNNLLAYQAADANSQQEVDRFIQSRTETILSNLLPTEQSKIDQIPLTKSGIPSINSFYDEFYNKYNFLSTHHQIEEKYTRIKEKKVSILETIQEDIDEEIDQAINFGQLDRIQGTYCSKVDQYHPTVSGIKNKVSLRKEEIILEEKERQQARIRQQKQQELEQKLAEERALAAYGFDFNTENLTNGKLMEAFFKGNFIDIPFNRDDLKFASLIEDFMYTQGRSCFNSATPGVVQIYVDVCIRESVTRDRNYNVVDRSCVEWEKRGTNVYTSPELYNAFNNIKLIQAGDASKSMGRLFKDIYMENNMNSMMEMVYNAVAFEKDVQDLINLNGCGNTALKRFTDNLIRFANGQAPIKINGAIEKQVVDYSKNHNFKDLMEELVYENSRSWAMNEYTRNSLKNVHIVSEDDQGRPIKISASYNFNGILGAQVNSVELTFKEGIPDCMYFADYRYTCRTPDRRIVSKFVKGEFIIH